MPLYSIKKYIQLITMKSEPLHVLHNPIGGLIFLSTWRHETSKKLLNGDGSFLKGKIEGENALRFFWGSRWKELQFYFLIISKKFARCVTCFPGILGNLYPRGHSQSLQKKKSHEEEEFYFVSFGQKKKAHEACIQCIQCKHHVHNRTDFSEC